jgi:hypothetical protein
MTVKGSEQYRLKVVAHRPGQLLMIRVAATVVVVVLITVTWWVARNQASVDLAELEMENVQLQGQVHQLESELDKHRQQLVSSQVNQEVGAGAQEQLRQQIIDLEKVIASLQESNQFYRQTMEPGSAGQGLRIGSLNLLPTNVPRHYLFEILVQQLAVKHELLNGSLKVVIMGKQNNQPVSYNLADISTDIAAENIKLRFRFFQKIEGGLVLPEGFEPFQVNIEATRAGAQSGASRSFGWLVDNASVN